MPIPVSLGYAPPYQPYPHPPSYHTSSQISSPYTSSPYMGTPTMSPPAENEPGASWGKRSKALKNPISKDEFQPNITNSVNDDTDSMPGKLKTPKNAAAFGSTGGNTRIFVSCTISEDRTGSQESVIRERLSALGARCRKRKMLEFPHSLV
jgi:hypothetical protein